MHFFRKKLEHYRELIEAGKHSIAAIEMEQYLQQGLEEESDAAQLMHLAQQYDELVKQTTALLQQGMPEDALQKLEEMKGVLKQIKIYAEVVGKDEEKLE